MDGINAYTPREHRREREAGRLVYPVNSRRSGGLSVGVNLFPDKKLCNFDCPYCEVFPFSSHEPFNVGEFALELEDFFSRRKEAEFPLEPVCFSGNGEPTLSPVLGDALEAAETAREKYCPSAKLVLITNSSGFCREAVYSLLDGFASQHSLSVWAKLDAGNEDWYAKMNRSSVKFPELLSGLERWIMDHDTVIQTMLCAVRGEGPSLGELLAYADVLNRWIRMGARITEIHLYGQARPAPDASSSPLPNDTLEEAAQDLRTLLADAVPVRTFGA
jgi:histidinol dehydrogenase